MGDRVSIQFKGGDETSSVLFAHWGGSEFPKLALKFAKKMKKDMDKRSTSDPSKRMEGGIVMLNFILDELKNEVGEFAPNGSGRKGKYITSSFYIVPTENDGDNSDNGHFIIDCDTLTIS